MEAALKRAGLWFGLLIVFVVAIAAARDSGFAAHMIILAVVAFAGLCISMARIDFDAVGNRIVRAPADPSRYDDDPCAGA
jgi:cytochrome c oxidase cbb3-type subunit 1